MILGTGDYQGKKEYNVSGKYLVPGLIDAHVHIESSLLTPREYSWLVAQHGTATVIADPHEIANVAGSPGIEFMLSQRKGLPGRYPVYAPVLCSGNSAGYRGLNTGCSGSGPLQRP